MFRGQGTQQLGVHLRYVNEMSSSPAEVGMSQDGFRGAGRGGGGDIIGDSGRRGFARERPNLLVAVKEVRKSYCARETSFFLYRYIYIHTEYCYLSSSF